MGTRNRYSPEVRERAVRLVVEHQGEHESQWAAICSIAAKIGCSPETLRSWMRRYERDQGLRPGLTTEERGRIKDLEREVRELRRTNEILRKASAFFAQAELDRITEVMVSFIDEQRERYGVKPICKVLPTAPSTYYEQKAGQRDPTRLPARVRRDLKLSPEIERVWKENRRVYGAEKI
jgi:putative transposase